MKKNQRKIIILVITYVLVGIEIIKSQTVDLNTAPDAGQDEIKAALKVEQRNYDNLASMLKEGTVAANDNDYYQKSWQRWINSKIQAEANKNNKSISHEKLLSFIRNRSDSLNDLVEESNQQKEDLLSQVNVDLSKPLQFGSELALQEVLKSLANGDYPMDVHPEDAVKNNESLKKIEEIPKVDLQALSGSPDEVANKFMMKQSGFGDMDEFIHCAKGFIPGKTTKQDIDKKLENFKKTSTPTSDGENWMFILRGLKMKITDGATASVMFDKDGVLKKITVTSISSGKMEKAFDSDDKKDTQETNEEQIAQFPTEKEENNGEILDLNTPKVIALLVQKGDFEKLKKLLKKSLGSSQQGNLTSLRKRLYNLLCLVRLELDTNNITDAIKYAEEADKLVKENTSLKPSDRCLKDIYLSKVKIYEGDQKGAEEALATAIQIFNDKIDSGYPVTGHQSPLIAGIIENLFEMPSRFQNVDYIQKEIALLSDPLERLITTPKDNLTIPSEQIILDSFKAVLVAADLLLNLGNYADAIKLIDDGIIYTDRGRYHNFSKESIYYINALEIKAIASKLSGDNKLSSEILNEWMENYKQQFSDVIQCSSEEQRLLFSSKQHPLNFLMVMGDPLKVAELLFFYKGSVIDSILTSKAIINNSNDSNLKRKLSELDQHKSMANSGTDTSSMEQDLANEVRKHFKETDVLEVIKSQNFRKLSKNLPKNTAFIDFFKYDSFGKVTAKKPSYGAIVITDNGKLSLVKLNLCEKIDSLVNGFRKANQEFVENNKDSDMSAICSSLYNELLQPLEPYLQGCNNLVISPEGKLNFVPFAAFVDHQGKFVIENSAIHYVSSGRDLLKEFGITPNKTITIIANPIFSRTPPPATDQPVFPQLPGTAKEAELVKDAMTSGSYSVTELNEEKASKNSVMQLDHPRILHIATHGFNLLTHTADSEGHPTRGMKIVAGSSGRVMTNVPVKANPMFKTGLAFSGANDTFQLWNSGKISNTDGILTAAEVPLINLNGTSLVTLSACQTGEGEAVGSEGVFGLRRGFLQSGAKNLLMTLWPIADQETVNIMSEFYKRIAENDDDPSISLSEVQRQWMPKLKSEKGICYAVNRAAPFVIFTKGRVACSNFSGRVSESRHTSQPDEKVVHSSDDLNQCLLITKEVMNTNRIVDLKPYCTSELKELIKKGEFTTPDDPIGFFDSDIRYDTQDDNPKILQMGPAKRNGELIEVPVLLKFNYAKSDDESFTKRWVFTKEDNEWKVEDLETIKKGQIHPSSLFKELQQYNPPPAFYKKISADSNITSTATSSGSTSVLEFNEALGKADAGDAYAQGVVSIYYTMGYKVPKDTAKGLAYAMKSASQKNSLGIYQVGALRELGVGMKKSKKEGNVLMSSAFDGLNAMTGDPYALFDLGMMALEGVGVDQNPKEAARLFKVSADMGYAPAQRMYALLLEKGVGVSQNPDTAKKYKDNAQSQWPSIQ